MKNYGFQKFGFFTFWFQITYKSFDFNVFPVEGGFPKIYQIP